MKKYLKVLSVAAILFVAHFAAAQLVPGPTHPKPPPYNPPPPAYQGSCISDLCIGDTVINILRDYRKAQIVGIEPAGTFVLRFIDNGGVGGNWGRQDLATVRGCFQRVCVGDSIFNNKRDYRKAQIVGLQVNGLFVIQFMDTKGVGGNWALTDFAFPFGCGRLFCVGDLALNIPRNYRKVQVIGVDYNRTYVLRFLDTQGVGGNWSDSDLVRTY